MISIYTYLSGWFHRQLILSSENPLYMVWAQQNCLSFFHMKNSQHLDPLPPHQLNAALFHQRLPRPKDGCDYLCLEYLPKAVGRIASIT